MPAEPRPSELKRKLAMRRSLLCRCALTATLVALLYPVSLTAATTATQRRAVQSIKTTLRKASNLVESGKLRDAIPVVKQAQQQLSRLAGDSTDADLAKLLEPVVKDLQGVHGLLELEGFKLPPLPAIKVKQGTTPQPGTTPPAGEGGISFSRQIAPLLASKCGSCHVDDDKGKVSMANYAALMRGSPTDGIIVMPGKGQGSRVIEVIESGDMPRGGGRVSRAELALLTKWIDEGAKYDAPNPNLPLRQLARAAGRQPQPMVTIQKPTGNETVSFSLDVAPVLSAQCMGCHGTQNPRADFSLATFERLMRGGDGGAPIKPGEPATSLLVRKLKGQAGERMPLDRPPLPAATIAKIEKWIAEGAKFDGPGVKTPLDRVAALAVAKSATPEELSRQRAELAGRNWRLAIPDDAANRLETKNFLLIGNVGEGRLDELAEIAEAQVARVASQLKAPAGQPLVKGRVTLFIFANRFDYSEFGTMVEKRQLPRAWRGHWKADLIDPYITVVPPTRDEYSVATLIAGQLASVHIASRGSGVPRWFAEGAGRAVAAKLDPKDGRVKYWDELVPQAAAQLRSPDDFITGKLSPDDSDVLSYSFVSHLMSNKTRFGSLMEALGQGAALDAAVARIYRTSPAQLIAGWAARAGR